ncbi:MAG TPA: isoleucine--tRNA ligase [Gaiellaceae bacterium]|nr:isoleucine--tRNA ligase [Gaiellaceae bacterium]
MAEPIFQPLPDKPDHPALEREILAWWDEAGVFDRLREQNRGGPRFSFMDGPITANAPAGVHHGIGRTYKDVYQRYKALRGHELRYQNGFDSQGLHVEVQVEKELGLDSKREIEEYGIAAFARRCRDFVARFAAVQTEQSKRLGMWMDWENSYFTFSDTNIEYIWRFLKEVQRRGWLYKGHRATQWCPRCGTSLSKHEQSGEENYIDLEHPSLYVRFPLRGREGEALVVWTTTPWTLPANVAAAVKPDAEYGRNDVGEWVAVERYPDEHFDERVRGSELVGLEYEGPFDAFAAQEGVVHRVIPWDEVSLDEGTGIVHIAPGAGAEDFELSRIHDLQVLTPIDESGRMLPGYGSLEGMTTEEVVVPVIESLRERGLLVEATSLVHRYPICWRCRTPLVFRVVDDWFISADEIRQPMLDGNAQVEWTPPQYGKRMDDWLRNMGDWNISRRRYFGLPLPFYECECGVLNVVGSRAELEERAVSGLDQLEELHRPWIDAVRIRCEGCGGEVERIPEVGDAWLDAGIVHFSTLGWQNPDWIPGGYATGASAGLSGADLPDHAYWEKWFPADWVSEMRQQIRLWFYSQCFMAIALDGRQPYGKVLTYEKVLDEDGREMHKSWGNAIELNDALERMGADVMRWLYCEQNPSQDMRFGYGPADEVKRRFLTFWNSVRFFVDYANIEGFRPSWDELAPADLAVPLDRWLVERTHAFVRAAEAAYEQYDTPAIVREYESFADDLSNWYIRRSRRRFWEGGDEAAFRTLWYALAQALRVVSPVLPFVTEHLWRVLVLDGPESVHLAGWPDVPAADEELLAEIAEVRRVVELGRQARAKSGIKLRQPLRTMAVFGATEAVEKHGDEIASELRVRGIERVKTLQEVRVKPNLPTLGPRFGSRLPAIAAALERLDFDQDSAGDVILRDGDVLKPNEWILTVVPGNRGWPSAAGERVAVALDPELDDELLVEGEAYELIHRVNSLRKKQGFQLIDRIVLTVPSEMQALMDVHGKWIAGEVLATEIRVSGDVLEIEKS